MGALWWARMWTTPQATQWDQMVHVAARRAQLEDIWAETVRDGKAPAPVSGEMRMLEHELGLTPKAMKELRWRLAADEQHSASRPTPQRKRRLRVVGATEITD